MSVENSKDRSFQGKMASLIGIAVNVLLAIAKIIAGVVSGAIAVLADGLNNLTDCGSSMVSMVSFKLSAKPADKEHPYGHERIEYVCSAVVAFIILTVALETLKGSIEKIVTPTAMTFSYLAVGVLCTSILAKCGLFFYYRHTARKINSDILRASAADSLTDCISTSVALISLIIFRVFGVQLDGYAGILVTLFIAWSGIGIFKETLSKLIGQAPDEETIEGIKARVLAHPGVLGIHDLAVYSYGPNKYFASVHVEVDANVDVLASHEMVDEIEREFATQTNILLTGHLDPIVTDDERVNALKEKVLAIVKGIDERFTLHDFRMVFGEKHTNVLFDVAIPFDGVASSAEIKKQVEAGVRALDEKYFAIVTVEHSIT